MTDCVLDTDVVIAALDRSDAHHRDAVRGVQALLRQNVRLLLSLVNYAETLVKPAESEQTLRMAIFAIRALGIELVAPSAAIACDAARIRGLSVSVADGFALATARARNAGLASFDLRVRRALGELGVALVAFAETDAEPTP